MTQVSPTGLAKSGMWNGTRLEGEPWTEQQKTKMILIRGTVEDWDYRTITLKRPRERTAADIACCRPQAECFDLVDVDCPILHRGMDSVTVITPGGDEYRLPTTKRGK